MHIQRADFTEISLIMDLGVQTWKETFTGLEHYTEELVEDYVMEAFAEKKIEEEMSDANNRFYLISEDCHLPPVGYLKLKEGDKPACVSERTIIGLERLYFVKDAHRKGLGSQAFEFALREARALGYGELWLSVWEHNHPALNFYKKMGCQQAGSWDWTFYSKGKKIVDLDYIMTRCT